MPLRLLTTCTALLVALTGCSAPRASTDPFESTGELIAFSGGEAGAAAACATCHGLAGEGDGALAPRLAGIDSGHALRQLENYASGARRHPQMEWIARQLSLEARHRVADHYAALPAAIPTEDAATARAVDCAAARLYHLGDAANAIASCASCHGADGNGNPGNPPLAGQPAAYLARQLDAWASGQRYGDPGRTMTRISQSLSPRDRRAVADYAASLRGDGGDRSVPGACLRTHRPD